MARTASLKRIERQIAELQAKAEALKQSETPGIKQLRAVIVKYKLKPKDIQAALKPNGRSHALAGRKLDPKYHHPETKETWSGRGLKPKWLVEALKKRGTKLKDFA